MTVETAFGRVLKAERESAGLTQLEVAELSELDVTYISLLERGRRQPSLKSFIRIARALRVSPVDLLRKTLTELGKAQI